MQLVLFLAILSLLVFVHEAGHFFAAKKAGIKVMEFGFGLPPRIFGKQIGETIYSINALPIGGFVRLFGEEIAEMDEVKADETTRKHLQTVAFFSQKKIVRVIVLTAGVFMNFMLGVFLFSMLYTLLGIPTPVDEVQVVGILPESPASSTFVVEDIIVDVEGVPVGTPQEFQEQMFKYKGKEVLFNVQRGDGRLEVRTLARENPPEGEGSLGIVIAPKIEFMHYPIWQMPFRGGWFGLQEAYHWGKSIIIGLGGMVATLFSGSVPKEIGGPIEIYHLVSEVSQVGIVPVVQLIGILSVNLAVINLLPLPALDGGRLVFVFLEGLIGRPVNAKFERVTHSLGMAFLLALMLAITIQDILRRSGAESLFALLKQVIPI
jgi:regulator of sigma E protease